MARPTRILLADDVALPETLAIYESFSKKRELMIARTRAMGMHLDREPDGTFYCFVSLRDLPEPLTDGMAFFRAALEKKVICVPGRFFDVNPGQRRAPHWSRFRQYVRLSFGPEIAEVERGLDRLEAMIREA
ncbi:MAG: hypothetical protein HC897_06165 [Thermoanaerobaculia bacterium]|nr:hypothetical protein [Thermoanaerobaculia bacterium]